MPIADQAIAALREIGQLLDVMAWIAFGPSSANRPVGDGIDNDGIIMTVTAVLELVGAGEAARILGVRPPNFVRDWSRRAGFPAPVGQVGRGRVWRRDEVEAFRQRVGPQRGTTTRQLALSDDARRWLPTIKRRIVRRCRPIRIVLFGSQARSEADQGSDLDVLIVMRDGQGGRVSAAEVRTAIGRVPIGVDVIVVTHDEVDRALGSPASVLRPALREGRTIYAAR